MKFTREKYFGTLKKSARLPYLEATYGNAEYHAFFNTICKSIITCFFMFLKIFQVNTAIN